MTLLSSYPPFLSVLWTMAVFFAWIIWFWLLITVFSDLFRRHDAGGFTKVLWMIFVIILPYLGVFVYLIANHNSMTERAVKQQQAAQQQLDEHIRSVAPSSATADIEKAKQLLDSGAITQAEYDTLKAKALAAGERRRAGAEPDEEGGNQRLAILLAMAMFVLVVDTSVMNVSIASVVHDLHTTVSGVQSAIALEALVSAAFILIGSKVGDLIGRKRAYVLGLLGYAIGALAMALAQSLTAVIVFWAVVGGLGASLLLPAMQSLIHGNFEGAAQKKAYALVGAAAAIAAAVGPLLGGFITTYLSWRIAFLLEDVIILIVLLNIKLVRDVPYTGPRSVDVVGAVLSVLGMGGIVLGILVWQEGGEAVGALLVLGALAMVGPGLLARAAKARGKADADRPRPVQVEAVPVRDLRADAPADRPGRHHDRAADLPADGVRVQRDAGRPVARAALADDVRDGAAGGEEGGRPPCQRHHPGRVRAADDRDS